MQSLKSLIDLLTKGRKIHISIVDVGGVLAAPSTEIPFENVIHSKQFCNIAKSTECGYKLCLYCKKLANSRAINEKSAFFGSCFYGIYEAVAPVIIGGAVVAIVYVGNSVVDEKKTRGRIERTSRHTGVDGKALLSYASKCERDTSGEELLGIAEIVGDYLKMLYSQGDGEGARGHWLVLAMKRHAEQEFSRAPSLRELSVIYHKNEKYMGRLFAAKTGVSYNKYCLGIKLEAAERMLLQTNEKIIDIALECGFENVSYFNRSFKDRYGTSPTEHRENKY